MKKLLALVLSLGLVFSLSACVPTAKNTNKNSGTSGSNTTVTEITSEEAIEIALNTASLNREEVINLETEIDYERGIKVWQVEFDHGNKEYSYDIDISTGKIVEADKDLDY